MADALAQTLEEEGSDRVDQWERFKIGQGGAGGSGWASVGDIKDSLTGDKYFFKRTGMDGADMLNAERAGLKVMYDTQTIRVPRPVCGGTGPGGAFAVFEYMNMGGRGTAETSELMGAQLAQMHRCASSNGMYGFEVDNTIGATEQPNGWMDSWVDFWVERRLKHMLRLSERDGAVFR
ncbi:unnamed protein product, partial [Choristocarpus tenellus]